MYTCMCPENNSILSSGMPCTSIDKIFLWPTAHQLG